MKYIFYERRDAGVFIAARMDDDGKIVGPKANMIRRFLLSSGYPKMTPDKILCGARLWAAEVLEKPKDE